MRITRHQIRKATFCLMGIVFAVSFTAPVGQFFISLVEEWGWYQHPNARVATMLTVAIAWFSAVAQNSWFHWMGGGIVGFALGAWIDAVFKVRETRQSTKHSSAFQALTKESGSMPSSSLKGTIHFDPTTCDGTLTLGDGHLRFAIHFYKQDSECIGVSKSGTNLKEIYRIEKAKKGDRILLEDSDGSSRDYAIKSGEYFIAKNHESYFMIARIDAVAFEGRAGADKDEIQFTYELDPSGKPQLTAI